MINTCSDSDDKCYEELQVNRTEQHWAERAGSFEEVTVRAFPDEEEPAAMACAKALR